MSSGWDILKHENANEVVGWLADAVECEQASYEAPAEKALWHFGIIKEELIRCKEEIVRLYTRKEE